MDPKAGRQSGRQCQCNHDKSVLRNQCVLRDQNDQNDPSDQSALKSLNGLGDLNELKDQSESRGLHEPRGLSGANEQSGLNETSDLNEMSGLNGLSETKNRPATLMRTRGQVDDTTPTSTPVRQQAEIAAGLHWRSAEVGKTCPDLKLNLGTTSCPKSIVVAHLLQQAADQISLLCDHQRFQSSHHFHLKLSSIAQAAARRPIIVMRSLRVPVADRQLDQPILPICQMTDDMMELIPAPLQLHPPPSAQTLSLRSQLDRFRKTGLVKLLTAANTYHPGPPKRRGRPHMGEQTERTLAGLRHIPLERHQLAVMTVETIDAMTDVTNAETSVGMTAVMTVVMTVVTVVTAAIVAMTVGMITALVMSIPRDHENSTHGGKSLSCFRTNATHSPNSKRSTRLLGPGLDLDYLWCPYQFRFPLAPARSLQMTCLQTRGLQQLSQLLETQSREIRSQETLSPETRLPEIQSLEIQSLESLSLEILSLGNP